MEKTNHMEYMEGMEVIASDIMEQVITSMEEYDYMAYSEEDVISALKRDRLSPKDFGALLSPAAAPFLEEMAKQGLKDVQHGEFGADMQITLVNDGPVTIVVDTEEWGK